MRTRVWLYGVLAGLLLQGALAPAHAGSSVQLYGDNDAPRFSFYLACVSKTVNCEIIERLFGDWADTRKLDVHTLTPDEASHAPSDASDAPYRVTVRYAPEMGAPSHSLSNGSTGLPVVSYVANVHVFDTATGKLLKSMSWHDETVADRDYGSANPYFEAQVRNFLKHFDPAYTKPAS